MIEREHGKWLGGAAPAWMAMALLASACAPEAARPPASLPPIAEKKAEAPPSQRVYVTIDADDPEATLAERRETCDMPVCQAPCNRVIEVKRGTQYSIIGPHLQSSRAFDLYSPQDPVAYLKFEGTTRTTNGLLRGIFMATIITGGILTLGGAIGVPFAGDEQTQTVLSAIGATGVLLMLPIGGGIFGPISGSYSESNVRFLDPTTRPELRDKIR